MSRIVAHTMATPDLEPVAALDLAQQLGLAGIELVCQDAYRCGISADATVEDTRALARAAARRGLRIVGLVPYTKGLNAASAGERNAAVAELCEVARRAEELGCSGMRVLAGSAVLAGDWDDALKWLGAALHEVAEFAAERGVAVCVENHMGTMAESAAATMSIVAAAGASTVGVVYDQANLAIMGAESPAAALELQASAIRHVHVKDFVPSGADRTPTLPGDGSVAWADVIAGLARLGYDGYFSLEYEKRWYPDVLPAADVGLPIARDRLQQMLDDTAGETG